MKLKKLFLCLLALSASITAYAYELDSNGVFYNVIDATEKTVEVTYVENGTGNADFYYGDVIIPRRFSKDGITYTVTAIGASAFTNCNNMTSITIPNSVETIGSSAFQGCSGLKSVKISDLAAWCGIKFTTSMSQPLLYADHLVLNGAEIKDLAIPNSVTSIGQYAFSGYKSLNSVVIPISVTSIEWGAFFGCSGLTSVTIPGSVTSIGGSAFSNCSGLTSVTISNGVTSIGIAAFSNCSNLTSLTIPGSVTSIRDNAFDGCTGLTSVTIPGSVTSIGSSAFQDCTGLTSVTIPSSVTSIGSFSFSGCSGLTSIAVENGNTAYDSRDNCNAIIKTSTNELIAGCNNTTIPNSVTSIGNNAFSNCTGLSSVTIPNGVTSIKNFAFYGCSGLSSVTIPNSVTSLGTYAFWGCSGLTSVTISGNVTKIGEYTFQRCSGLTSVTIPNSVTSIGKLAFSNCSGLTSVTIGSGIENIGEQAFAKCPKLANVFCHAVTVPDTKTDAFSDTDISRAKLHVPASSRTDYYNTQPWRGFGKIVAISDIGPCATPTVEFSNGKLIFDCETEGAEFNYWIDVADANDGTGKEVDMTGAYRVTVYASKEGYDDSEPVTYEFDVRGKKGDVNGDGTVSPADAIEALYIFFGVGQNSAPQKIQQTVDPQ